MVIARFSIPKALAYVIGCLAFCAIYYFVTLRHPPGMSLEEYLASKGAFRFPVVAAGWLAGGLFVLLQTVILNQILFHKGNAIWAKNGKIFYLNVHWNILYTFVGIGDIISVSIGKTGRLGLRAIVIQLQDGGQKAIPTWIFLEPADVILARIKGAITEFRGHSSAPGDRREVGGESPLQ